KLQPAGLRRTAFAASIDAASSLSDSLLQERKNVRDWHLRSRSLAPRLVFDDTFLQPALADRHPVRHADQLEVSKHYARALAAVVEQYLDARRLEGFVQAIGLIAHDLAAIVADRGDRDRERRHRERPDDTPLVVVLLDRRGDDARHSDAVAAHLEDVRPPLGVEVGRAHRLRVDVAECEYMADLDAAHDRQRSAAVGRLIAL